MTRRGKIILGSAICIALASSALALTLKNSPKDKWAEVDNFKAGLPAKLESSQGRSSLFNIVELSRLLSRYRIDGMPICAMEEVSAQQYVELSVLANKLAKYPPLTMQLNALLESEEGLSDCQFRILQAAAR